MRRFVEASPLWWRLLVSPLSALYAVAVTLRNVLFDVGVLRQARLPGKVISVGNLAAGGTGKSPVVIALAESLKKRGFRPAILTRGYGGGLQKGESLALLGERVVMSAGREVRLPDEPRMQAAALNDVPVVVGASRAAAATRFLVERPELKPTHWLLDDGFQHRSLARDLDIVLLDSREPFGPAGAMLPGGILREPTSALKRADLVLCTRSDQSHPNAAELARLGALSGAPTLAVPFALKPPRAAASNGEAFDSVRHFPAFLAAGIARPGRLESAVKKDLGIALSGTLFVPDHAPFDRQELVERSRGSRSLLVTAKDYWRHPDIFAEFPLPVYVLPLAVEWNEEAVASAIASTL